MFFTFIEMTRILSVVQLCIIFMMIAWYASYPFMGELFHHRSHLFLAQSILGDDSLLSFVSENKREETYEKLQLFKSLFNELPSEEKNLIKKDANYFQNKTHEGWKKKLTASLRILFEDLPPYKRAWLFFSFLICLALLYRIKGSRLAVWLLPLLAFCYLIDNSLHSSPKTEDPEKILYPSEKYIYEEVLQIKKPVPLQEQKKMIEKGWETFIITIWAHQVPSEKPEHYKNQIAEGEFHFNLARLSALRNHPYYEKAPPVGEKEPLVLLMLYFTWNIIFATLIFITEGEKVHDQVIAKHSMDCPYNTV